jgi:hypothetical protein
MDESHKTEIDALMKQHDARTGKRADDQRAEDEFATEFGRLRREVIKPAMEQVVEQLKAGSHHAAIAEVDPTPTKNGKKEGAPAIRLEILPAGAKRELYGKHDLPGVTFTIEPGMRVGVYSRSGRPDEEQGAGPMRRFRANEVTPEMVTTEILEVLRKTF